MNGNGLMDPATGVADRVRLETDITAHLSDDHELNFIGYMFQPVKQEADSITMEPRGPCITAKVENRQNNPAASAHLNNLKSVC